MTFCEVVIPSVYEKLKDIIGDFYVVGGVVRRKLAGIPYDECDIDIVSPVHEPYVVAGLVHEPYVVAGLTGEHSWNGGMGSKNFWFDGRKINVLPMKNGLAGTLKEFDFTCCQVAFDTNMELVCTVGESVLHINTRRLVPTEFLLKSKDKDLLNRSWCRMAKLTREGFKMSEDDLLALCDHWMGEVVPYLNGGQSECPSLGLVMPSTSDVVF